MSQDIQFHCQTNQYKRRVTIISLIDGIIFTNKFSLWLFTSCQEKHLDIEN